MSQEKIIQRGAEAIIILKGAPISERTAGGTLRGAPNNFIIKRRVKKSYRLSELDERIRKLRTRSEGKLLKKASEIISIPKVKKVDEETKEISMEFLEGKKLSENLDSLPLKEQKKICKEIGKEISKLHDADIIHGDLTTSNMILFKDRYSPNKKVLVNEYSPRNYGVNNFAKKSGEADFVASKYASDSEYKNKTKIFFIDFGLGFISKKTEDKAVDLHLLKQALEAKHFKNSSDLFKGILKGYSSSENSKKVLEQFKKVEKRGRYKDKY